MNARSDGKTDITFELRTVENLRRNVKGKMQQQATTRSLQSSDVVDEEESIVSVVDLGWARTRSGRRPVTRSGRRPVTKQVGLGKKKKEGVRREQEAAVVQGESGNEANGAGREKKKKGARREQEAAVVQGESGNERSKLNGGESGNEANGERVK
ncbi:hypothetical protein WN943_025346 [Citrus x changshan-huyou]